MSEDIRKTKVAKKRTLANTHSTQFYGIMIEMNEMLLTMSWVFRLYIIVLRTTPNSSKKTSQSYVTISRVRNKEEPDNFPFPCSVDRSHQYSAGRWHGLEGQDNFTLISGAMSGVVERLGSFGTIYQSIYKWLLLNYSLMEIRVLT